MKFKVVGSNRQTGARVTMELDATSRAMAERKGEQAGVEVLHVEQMIEAPDGDAGADRAPRVTHRGEFPDDRRRGVRRLLALLVFAAAVALVVTFWGQLRSLLAR